MKIRLRDELIPLNMLVLVLIFAIAVFPSNGLRIALGLPFLLFFPGYTLMATLFPERGRMDAIERVGLSFGMSIAVVPLIGLAINYTPWGISLGTILYSTASFIFIMSVIAWFRRKRLAAEKRLSIEFQLKMPGWGGSTRDNVLSIILVITILGALGTLGYVIAVPKVGERFTEFYVLGVKGEATDYPKELRVGQEGKVIVGIVNSEHETVSYQVEIRLNGVENNEIGPIVLEHGEKWEQQVSFTPQVAGEKQKVEFLLFRKGQSEAYEGLNIWVNVKQ